MEPKGQSKDVSIQKGQELRPHNDSFVLDKGIFSNIFEKDIRRVYIYKKAERLAKAIHLVSPAFRTSPALRNRMDQVAIGLVDAAILPPISAKDNMSRELLALSSVLSIARTGGLLSGMNAELISREAQQLLQEIATYEEPRIFLEEAPSLAALAKEAGSERYVAPTPRMPDVTHPSRLAPPFKTSSRTVDSKGQDKGQMKDKTSERRQAITSILQAKGPSHIKDISTMIRDVSEKTIQRELQALIDSGQVVKTGERRWTQYAVA